MTSGAQSRVFRREIGSLVVSTVVTGTWRENCYLLHDRDAGEALVIDPGDDAEAILALLGETEAQVRHLICTHAHYDHIAGANAVASRYGLQCLVHARDRKLFGHAPTYALGFEKKRITLPKEVVTFDDGAEFALGSRIFTVISTPGHTPGGVCLQWGPLLFSGDTLLRGAVGRVDLPGGDRGTLDDSVERLVRSVADEIVILPGHGQPWEMSAAKVWWDAPEGEPTEGR